MPRWMRRALCVQFPTMPWVAEPHARSVAAERAMAVVCTACPVQVECASYAGSQRVTSGFWAGVDRTPRRAG
jgi:hypothetical protein